MYLWIEKWILYQIKRHNGISEILWLCVATWSKIRHMYFFSIFLVSPGLIFRSQMALVLYYAFSNILINTYGSNNNQIDIYKFGLMYILANHNFHWFSFAIVLLKNYLIYILHLVMMDMHLGLKICHVHWKIFVMDVYALAVKYFKHFYFRFIMIVDGR